MVHKIFKIKYEEDIYVRTKQLATFKFFSSKTNDDVMIINSEGNH